MPLQSPPPSFMPTTLNFVNGPTPSFFSSALDIKAGKTHQTGDDVLKVFPAIQLWSVLHVCAATIAELCLWFVHSRECVSSQWQLPKVLNTLLWEHCSSEAFVLLHAWLSQEFCIAFLFSNIKFVGMSIV